MLFDSRYGRTNGVSFPSPSPSPSRSHGISTLYQAQPGPTRATILRGCPRLLEAGSPARPAPPSHIRHRKWVDGRWSIETFSFTIVSSDSMRFWLHAGSAPKRGTSVGAERSLSGDELGGTCLIPFLSRAANSLPGSQNPCSFLFSCPPHPKFAKPDRRWAPCSKASPTCSRWSRPPWRDIASDTPWPHLRSRSTPCYPISYTILDHSSFSISSQVLSHTSPSPV